MHALIQRLRAQRLRFFAGTHPNFLPTVKIHSKPNGGKTRRTLGRRDASQLARSHRRKFAVLAFAFALFCGYASASAQTGLTTITASHISVSGTPIAAGTVTLTPVNTNGQPIAFVGGGSLGLYAPKAFSCTITAGAISGTCKVPDVALTTPSNILYTIDVTDTGSLVTFRLANVPNITGASWALDAYAPSSTTTNSQTVQVTYGAVAPPSSCATPSFYYQTGTGLFICVGGSPVAVTGGGGSAPLDATALLPPGFASGYTARIPIEEFTNSTRFWDQTFLDALHNAQNQVVHVVVMGDSFTRCDQSMCAVGPVVATNRWAEQLRLHLQEKYGSHGTGIVPLTGNANALDAQSWAISGTFDASTNTLGPSQISGPGQPRTGLVHLATGAVATFTTTIPYDTIRVYYGTTSSSGTLAVSIDGIAVGTASTAGTNSGVTVGGMTAREFTSSSVTLGTHTATFTCTGDCYVYAAQGTSGSAGVDVSNLAVGGTKSEYFGLNPATKLAFSDIDPDGTHLVITQIEVNNANDGDISVYPGQMAAIISHEQSLSATAPPSVLLTVPPVAVAPTATTMAPFTAAQIVLAQTTNVGLANTWDRWGNAFVAAQKLFDVTNGHPSDKGQLAEASQFWEAAIDPSPAGALIAGGCALCDVNITPQLTATGCTLQGVICKVTTAGTTITLSGIPAGYTNLRVIGTINDTTGGNATIKFNGDGTSANYVGQQIYTAGTIVNAATTTAATLLPMPGSPGGNNPGTFDFTIPGYSGTTFNKEAHGKNNRYNDGSSQLLQDFTLRWMSTSAINSVSIVSSDNLVVGSYISIYAMP